MWEQFDLSSSSMTQERLSVPSNSRRQQPRNNHNLCSTCVSFVTGSKSKNAFCNVHRVLLKSVLLPSRKRNVLKWRIERWNKNLSEPNRRSVRWNVKWVRSNSCILLNNKCNVNSRHRPLSRADKNSNSAVPLSDRRDNITHPLNLSSHNQLLFSPTTSRVSIHLTFQVPLNTFPYRATTILCHRRASSPWIRTVQHNPPKPHLVQRHRQSLHLPNPSRHWPLSSRAMTYNCHHVKAVFHRIRPLLPYTTKHLRHPQTSNYVSI